MSPDHPLARDEPVEPVGNAGVEPSTPAEYVDAGTPVEVITTAAAEQNV
jgi:hypothetical protein